MLAWSAVATCTVDKNESGKAEQKNMTSQPTISADDLQAQYDRWTKAVQAGDSELVSECERSLLGMINVDIAVSQSRVRALAEAVVLDSKSARPADSSEVDSGDSTPKNQESIKESRAEFRARLAMLNTKEALWLALEKTHNLSHKYRLLGDYINLLRRELHMPRAKWADIDSDGNATRPGLGTNAKEGDARQGP
jgi:hypothetical protein